MFRSKLESLLGLIFGYCFWGFVLYSWFRNGDIIVFAVFFLAVHVIARALNGNNSSDSESTYWN